MFHTDLYSDDEHRNIFIDESEDGGAIQANNHVIIHRGEVMLLDPGGHKVYRKLMADVSSVARISNIKTIFLSHQDPDIVASINGWLMTTDAVLWPTPGIASSSAKVRGTAPPWRSMISSERRRIALAFCGDSPHGRMMAWIFATGTCRMSAGLSAIAQSCGVTRLTRLSVHWAESNTATSSV